MQKKISESISVRIKVGDYQWVEISKYAEKTIEYQTEAEMIKLEDQLTDEITSNIIRNMRRLPERLGKKDIPIQEVESGIVRTIPEWMEEHNRNNVPKDKHEEVVEKQKQEHDKQEKNIIEIDELFTEEVKKESKTKQEKKPKDIEKFSLEKDEELPF